MPCYIVDTYAYGPNDDGLILACSREELATVAPLHRPDLIAMHLQDSDSIPREHVFITSMITVQREVA